MQTLQSKRKNRTRSKKAFKHKSIEKEFLPKVKNKRGSTLILFIFIISIISIFSFNITKIIIHLHHENKERLDIYQCAEEINKTLKKYYSSMEQRNKKIAYTYPLTLIPKTSPWAIPLLKTLLNEQLIFHISQLKKLTLNKTCSVNKVNSLMLRLPYGLKIKRDLNKTARLIYRRGSLLIKGKKNYSILLNAKWYISKKNTFSLRWLEMKKGNLLSLFFL